MNKKNIELNDKCNWTKIITRKSPTLWRNLEDMGYSRDNLIKHTGVDAFISWKKDEYDLSCNLEEYKGMTLLVKELVQQDETFFIKISDKCYSTCENYLNFCKEVSMQNFENMTNTELYDIFKQYMDNNLGTVAFRPIVLILDKIITEYIENEINLIKNTGAEVDFYYELITPTKELPFISQQKDVLYIGSIIENDSIEMQKFKEEKICIDNLSEKVQLLIRKHLDKFAWITTHRYLGVPLSVEDVIINIKEVLGSCQKRLKQTKDENQKKSEKLEQVCNINDHIKYLINIAKEYAFLRTFRMDAAIEGDYYLRNFFKAISNRFDLDNQYMYLTVGEILNLLKGLNNFDATEKIKKRKEYFITYLVNNNDIYIFEGIDNKLDNINFEKSSKIIGKVAQRGNIEGFVKIVRYKEEIEKIETGDIIVCPMTTPEMIVGLLKCSGIITDEGGISCHAAQISREFKIPCIIGTGNATSLLKDKDKVRLTANSFDGTVEIIEDGVIS